jgi:glutathione peroxidase
MYKQITVFFAFCVLFVAAAQAQTPDSTSIHQFSIPGANGSTINFSAYAGKKVLVVNTASLANNKIQISDLQTLQQNNSTKLVVVAIPCADFNNLEPEDSTSVMWQNYQQQFGVSYPVSVKLHATGTAIHPLFRFLTEKSRNGMMDGAVNENFRKFLLDEQGRLLASFSARVDPLDTMIQQAIDQ